MTGRPFAANPQVTECPYCQGGGCEECDQTGKRWYHHMHVDSHTYLSAQGAGAPSLATINALIDIGEAAVRRLTDTRKEDA